MITDALRVERGTFQTSWWVSCLILGCVVCVGCASSPPSPPPAWIAPKFSPSANERIAVLVRDASRTYSSDAVEAAITDRFHEALLQKGYRPVTRDDFDTIAKEIQFQHSGWTDRDAVEQGRIMNVPAVILVTLQSCSERYDPYGGTTINGRYLRGLDAAIQMSARLVGVSTAEVLGQATFSGTVPIESRDQIPEAVSFAAARLAAGFPMRSATP